MDQKESRRQKSSTRIAKMSVIRVDTMYRNYTTVVTVERKRRATLIPTLEQIHNRVQIKRISSFRFGNDGVGSRSWNAKLQVLKVEKQIN